MKHRPEVLYAAEDRETGEILSSVVGTPIIGTNEATVREMAVLARGERRSFEVVKFRRVGQLLSNVFRPGRG